MEMLLKWYFYYSLQTTNRWKIWFLVGGVVYIFCAFVQPFPSDANLYFFYYFFETKIY